MIQQFLRLPHENHAIKEASITLFFGSPFVHAQALVELLQGQFAAEFNQVGLWQGIEVQFAGVLTAPDSMAASSKKLGLPGVQAVQQENGTPVRVLQVLNEPERVVLALHNLRYERWADFLALFERVAAAVAPLLANMLVVAVGLHYQDVLEWTHPTEQLPLTQLYQRNPDYLPGHFFDGPFSELLLTVPSQVNGRIFFDRLHITSVTNNRPVATIGHNVVHQFPEATDLPALLGQPNLLQSVLQQAHDHNKTVLRGILQPEIQTLIGLTV